MYTDRQLYRITLPVIPWWFTVVEIYVNVNRSPLKIYKKNL